MTMAPFDRGAGTFRAAARRTIDRELAPAAARAEQRAQFPRRIIAVCGRRGYLSLDADRTAVLAEELVRCDSLGVTLSVFVQAGLIAPMLRELATDSQRRRFLRPLEAGRQISAMAVTEPHAGSDLAAIVSTARRDRHGGFIVSGEKTYITAAAAADFAIVAVRDGDAAGAGLSLLLIPTTLPGVRVSAIESLGLAATAMGRMTFKNCRLPADALLGEAGAGYGYIQDALNRERLYGGIGVVAWAERAIEKTAAFLHDRRAFGKSLNRIQVLRHRMAQLATELEAARQLNYATFQRWRDGGRVTKEIAMIKLFSYGVAQQTVDACLQMHGGLGYTARHWTSRWHRDAQALTIAAGTPEVMRELIAAHLRW